MAGSYRIEFTSAAQRDIKALTRNPPDGNILSRLDEAILALGQNPRPPGSIKLESSEFRRIVVGDYRVIYSVDDVTAVVLVTRIRHRREVYRDS